jgi:signal transduction histidine kinase
MPKDDLVLIAVDDEQIQRLFERAMAAASYMTVVTSDLDRLNRLLQEASPALVILSQEFDGNKGVEIAGDLLERFPTLPVLLFLAHDSPSIMRKALHFGVSDCLFPPLKIDDIILAVENSVRRANRLGDWTRREVKRKTASLQQRVDELQKFDTILTSIEDGVIILDEKKNILLINPAVRRAFGIWKDESVVGKPVLEVITHPELAALISGGAGTGLLHHEIMFDDGRALTAQYTLIPAVGSAITMQDITYLKQIDRLKNEFVSTVSHDLRSPLTAILGYVDLLERVGPMNDQQREFVKRVQVSVQSITSLVNDLLELGRIEAGLDGQKEIVPIEGIIRYALENFASQIAEKNLVVKTDFPAEPPPLRGNPIRLRQMLDNLVGNAIKYTPSGGKVNIEVETHSSQVILRVEDSGPGIPPAEQAHIFEKFYRASNVPKGVGGSGLGLAIVKSIVDNHRGRIWVESVLGQGSTFTVVLPLAEQAK